MKRFVALVFVFVVSGVAAGAFVSYAQKDAGGPGPMVINVESILGAQLDPEAQPIVETAAGRTTSSTARVLMVSQSLQPHSHATHDEIILIMRGKGDVTLAGRTREVRRGDLIFIPKGTVHAFVNTSVGFAGALSVMSPLYDGKDEIPAP